MFRDHELRDRGDQLLVDGPGSETSSESPFKGKPGDVREAAKPWRVEVPGPLPLLRLH